MRSVLMMVARLGVSAGLLVFLLITVDIDSDILWPDDLGALIWLLIAVGGVLASLVLASWRWQQVCQSLGLSISTWRLLGHTLAGQFLSNFVPTTVGGDVLRVRRLGRDVDDPPTAFTTVILERLSGWMVLPACILAGLALDADLRSLGAATRGAFLAAMITLVALLALIVAAGNDFTGRFLRRYEETLRWLHSVHDGMAALRAHPRQILRILGSGAIYQGSLIAAFWCAAQSIGVEGFGLRAAVAFVPAVLIVQVLPLGIGGLGVREGALVLFLGSIDVPDEQAVALGLTIYAITLTMSLLGLPSLVFGGRHGGGSSDSVIPPLPPGGGGSDRAGIEADSR